MREILYYNHDYVIRETTFPTEKLHGMCMLDDEGRANIYLNHKDTEEQKKKALKHEVLHYMDNDHFRDRISAESSMKLREAACHIDYDNGDYLIVKRSENCEA